MAAAQAVSFVGFTGSDGLSGLALEKADRPGSKKALTQLFSRPEELPLKVKEDVRYNNIDVL